MTRTYKYSATLNINYWSNQLQKINKKLTKNDVRLFKHVREEKEINKSLRLIHQYALTDELYIPCLTDLIGDCMFESIEHTGFCKDRNEFRKCIALIFFIFGKCKIIPSYDIPLKDVFELVNDIKYVFCHKKALLYKYTYYTMCSDMYNKGSWSRLPTELILMIISIFFKVRIHIYHDNGHIGKICDIMNDANIPLDDASCNIYLGLIGENHYVPLIKKKFKKHESKCPKYTIELEKFHSWAKNKADMIGLYNDSSDDSSDESFDNSNFINKFNNIC